MAVHDRIYMREESGWEPRERFPVIVWVLIAVVAGVVLHGAARGWAGKPITDWTVLTWDAIRSGFVWTAITYPVAIDPRSFSLWNLLLFFILYMYGKNLEAEIGRRRFLEFVCLSVLAGALLLIATSAAGVAQQFGGTKAFGVSGLATACVVHAAVREPKVTIKLIVIPMPHWVFAALWVAFSVLAAFGTVRDTGQNVWVDLGCAAYGTLATRIGPLPDLGAWLERSRRERESRAAKKAASERSDVQARVDALLDKISREGMPSLTDEERDFLNRASKRY